MPTIEPMIGPDIPDLPCIYHDECEDYLDTEYCPCDDYTWRKDEDK